MSQDLVAQEPAALELLRAVPQWRAALEAGARAERAWGLLCEEVERRARMAHGLRVAAGDPEVSALVEGRGLAPALWRDEHILGWFHQGWASVERTQSFADHLKGNRAHESVIAPTQLYTPRWLADWMAREALALVDARPLVEVGAPPSCVDPAMGGGQLLIAWLGALEARGVWGALELARSLSGVELDARAAHVARRGVLLWLERRFGALSAEIIAEVEARLEVGDGLVCGRESDVALSNPPYMGNRAMPEALRAELVARWAPFHMDLCAAFVQRCHVLARRGVGLLVQQAFWFLSRFEPARDALASRSHMRAMLHLGSRIFSALTGEKASVVASVHGMWASEQAARILDLREVEGDAALDVLARWEAGERVAQAYEAAPAVFAVLPGKPLAYWLPGALAARFGGARLGDVAQVPGALNKTSDNARYVRRWDAVETAEREDAPEIAAGASGGRWWFYSKGGRYAPWWGSWQHVVDWSEPARALYAAKRTASQMDAQFVGREGLCYTDFGGTRFNARWLPSGCICDMTGPGIFVVEEDAGRRRALLMALLGVLNSVPARMMLNALNPTLHYQVRDVRNLPLPDLNDAAVAELAAMTRVMVEGWRGLHRLLPGDPLFDAGAAGDWEARVVALEEAERALHRRVCALYGVEELAERELPRHRLIEELERQG